MASAGDNHRRGGRSRRGNGNSSLDHQNQPGEQDPQYQHEVRRKERLEEQNREFTRLMRTEARTTVNLHQELDSLERDCSGLRSNIRHNEEVSQDIQATSNRHKDDLEAILPHIAAEDQEKLLQHVPRQ